MDCDDVMKEGDLVILWAKEAKPTVLRRNEVFHHAIGSFAHNDIIGKPFGSKILSCKRVKRRKKWLEGTTIVALRPTPELWTEGALSHMTQILYTGDIATVCFNLNLKPGSIVMEAGSGSGSLSRAIARTVAPHGKLYTFEFNEARYTALKKVFSSEKLDDVIHISHRDVYQDGLVPNLVGPAKETLDVVEWVDAVFLDLPNPSLVVEDAFKRVKPEGSVCTFVPSLEQVKNACRSMESVGFTDIYTIEVRVRPYIAHKRTDHVFDLSYRPEAEVGDGEQPSDADQADGAPPPHGKRKRKSRKAPPLPIGVESRQVERITVMPTIDAAGHTGFLSFAYKPGYRSYDPSSAT